MKKKLLVLLCLCLAGAMLFAFAGCDDDGQTEGSGAQSGGSSEVTGEASSDESSVVSSEGSREGSSDVTSDESGDESSDASSDVTSDESSDESGSGELAGYDGTYYLYDGGSKCDDDAYFKLGEGNSWAIRFDGSDLKGVYTLSGDRIVFLHDLQKSDSDYRWLVEMLGVTEGEVELYTGTIKNGKIVLDTYVGHPAGADEFVFYLDGNITG